MPPTAPTRTCAAARRFARLTICLFMLAVPAMSAKAAEPATPVALVAQLYVAHAVAFAGNGPAVHAGGPAALAYFAPDLAAQMKAKRLDFDPVYDAQDAKISALRIVAHPQTPTQGDLSLVVVSFRNFGKPARLTYYLRRMPGGEWRIVDIASGEWRLTELLKKNS